MYFQKLSALEKNTQTKLNEWLNAPINIDDKIPILFKFEYDAAVLHQANG